MTPRNFLRCSAEVVPIKPTPNPPPPPPDPSQPRQSKPPQSHPTFHGQTHPKPTPTHTRTSSSQVQPFKTRSDPPQPIQSLVKPSQTHPKPTPNPPQTHPLLFPPKHGQTHSKIRACNTLKNLCCSKSKPAKSFYSAMSSKQLCTTQKT